MASRSDGSSAPSLRCSAANWVEPRHATLATTHGRGELVAVVSTPTLARRLPVAGAYRAGRAGCTLNRPNYVGQHEQRLELRRPSEVEVRLLDEPQRETGLALVRAHVDALLGPAQAAHRTGVTLLERARAFGGAVNAECFGLRQPISTGLERSARETPE